MEIKQGIKIFFIVVLINVSNVMLDHFFAPIGIDLSLIFSIASAIIIIFSYKKTNLYFKVIMIYLAVAINDIGIKLYGGGLHDNEGQLLINSIFVTECAIIILITVVGFFRQKRQVNKVIAFSLFLLVLLFLIHAEIFSSVGLGRYYTILYDPTT